MLAPMVLGWEDIFGGPTILAFLTWLVLTGLFYLVFYLAALNTLDHITRNSFLKFPALLAVAPTAAFIISIFSYNAMILFVLMMVSNYFRVKKMGGPDDKRFSGLILNRPLFYIASYLYIITLYALSAWLQSPVDTGDGIQPLWETWFPEVPEN